jgi:hypothetical protein
MKPQNYQTTLFSLMLLISSAAQAADVTAESEVNDLIASAQRIEAPHGNAAVTAVLGRTSGTAINDLDFYSFSGQEGDVVTLDIDGGMGGLKNVDTVIALFDNNGKILRMNDDAASIDEGSISRYDSRIDNFRLPATGSYVVGVSSYPRYFLTGGSVSNPTRLQNGDYSLVISGLTPPVQQINIDIKPGNDGLAPINPKSRGKIPVAILSSKDFNALNADLASLTFGATGDEASLSHCNPEGVDINHDGFVDLLCHFENQLAGFEKGDLEGILSGKQLDGSRFEGRSFLKIVPEKRTGL